jgi:hypothetical protein
VYELYNTYKELHKNDDKPTSDGKVHTDGKTYSTVGRPIIPEWLRKKIPDGATIFNADVATQEDIMN